MSDEIKVIIPTKTPYEEKIDENARATAMQVKAVQDYNIMMGFLEDPAEEDFEEVE